MTDNRPALSQLTEVVVPVEDPSTPDRGVAWAERLAPRLGLGVRQVHVEVDTTDGAGGVEALEGAIVAELADGSLIVMESEHADRWSGKSSIAEHVVDRFGHVAVVIGPQVVDELGTGPVLVALDGSERAERALAEAAVLADALGVGVEGVRVCPDPVGHPERASEAAAEARHYLAGLDLAASSVASSNDPVSALARTVADRSASLVVLASRGDRSTPRPVMAKTCSGLVASSSAPVVVVGAGGEE